jgi:hypothetical protein
MVVLKELAQLPLVLVALAALTLFTLRVVVV